MVERVVGLSLTIFLEICYYFSECLNGISKIVKVQFPMVLCFSAVQISEQHFWLFKSVCCRKGEWISKKYRDLKNEINAGLCLSVTAVQFTMHHIL